MHHQFHIALFVLLAMANSNPIWSYPLIGDAIGNNQEVSNNRNGVVAECSEADQNNCDYVLVPLSGDLVDPSSRSRKGNNKNNNGLMERILPLMVIPFLISTAIIPVMLVTLKAMLLKSGTIGAIAVVLLLLNMIRNRTMGDGGGVIDHGQPPMMHGLAMGHYGYSGNEEYGAYVNRRRRKRK